MLTATDLRTSITAKIKKVILLYCCTLTYDDVQPHVFYQFRVFDYDFIDYTYFSHISLLPTAIGDVTI